MSSSGKKNYKSKKSKYNNTIFDDLKYYFTKAPSWATIAVITLIVIFIRALLSQMKSHEIDMNMYVDWSNYLAANGPTGFYNHSHVVYGPIYMYLLMLSGKFSQLFSITTRVYQEYLVKFWPVLSDFVGAYFIYLIGKKIGKPGAGFWVGVFYVLSPALFMNSSIMGQFDSLPATMLIIVVYCFSIKKPVWAAIMYTVAALTKPQSVYLLPVVAYLFLFQDIEWSRLFSYKVKEGLKGFQYFKSYFLNRFYILKFVYSGIGVIFTYVITVLPFYISVPYPVPDPIKNATLGIPALPLSSNMLTRIIDLFMWFKRLTIGCSLGDYPYATADGFNFFTLIKGQSRPDSELINHIISYATLGKICMLLLAVFAIWILVRMKNNIFSIFLSAYILGFGFFMFYTRMHERYLVPAIIFTIVCVLWKRSLWIPALILNACCFANQYLLYDMAIKTKNYWFAYNYGPGNFIAFVSLCVFVYMCIFIVITANKDASAGKLQTKTAGRKK